LDGDGQQGNGRNRQCEIGQRRNRATVAAANQWLVLLAPAPPTQTEITRFVNFYRFDGRSGCEGHLPLLSSRIDAAALPHSKTGSPSQFSNIRVSIGRVGNRSPMSPDRKRSSHGLSLPNSHRNLHPATGSRRSSLKQASNAATQIEFKRPERPFSIGSLWSRKN